ncbi:hypothetical protein [Olivibacter ginsenosidimutans]
MKHIFILASLISGILICNPGKAGSLSKTNSVNLPASQQTNLIDVKANNSTFVEVNVNIQNQVTGTYYSFVVPPNVSNVVVGQVPKSDDYYNILMQASRPVKMRFYWAESSGLTTAFYAENVPLAGCESCPSIWID